MTYMTRGDLMEVRDELRDQILQLGAEMRVGFCALREETEEMRGALSGEIRGGDEETRRALSGEIRAGDEETRREMRVLHEDVLDRIARMKG